MTRIRGLLGQPRKEEMVRPGGLVGPDALEVRSDALVVGGVWCRTFSVTGYPREVRAGWLEPLLNHPAEIDVAAHITPIPTTVAADRLRRQLARLESSLRVDAARGRLTDPGIDVATSDARELAERVARGDGRLFAVSLTVTVRAPSEDALVAECARVRAVLASLLVVAHPTTFRALEGWTTTLPLGVDPLNTSRTFDTAALAASFPFASPDLSSPTGVLYGLNTASGGMVRWDRFAQPNYNQVILARSGSGKSFLAKVETLRWLYAGVEVAVVDPEDEYRTLADAVGGTYIAIGAGGVRLNPFDLGPEADALTRRALFIHTLIAALLGGAPTGAERAVLDRAVIGVYAAAGITADTRTHGRPPPILADLHRHLLSDPSGVGAGLAVRLEPFVAGTHRHLFDGPTTTAPDGQLVVFSLDQLPDELKEAGTLLTLDAVWRKVTDPARRRRRLVVVDEAWLVMRDPEGARFLFRLAKAARKHWCGLTVITQDAADLLGTELGQAVVANAATQVLMRQAPQAIDAVAAAFKLSDGERALLLAAPTGHALLAAGADRVAFEAVASPAEHRLATTNPAELEQVDL